METILTTPAELGVPETIPMPKRTDWRIGIVGFGGIARGAHMGAYKEAGWPVVAVADPDPAAREKAKEAGVPSVYEDYHDLVRDESVEIIDLCTQPTIRSEVVQAAADAGKHLITEKPLATTMDECLRMIEIAESAGIKLAVHQNYRWMKMNFLAHHIIAKGLIGEPFFADVEILGKQDVDLAGHPFYSKCTDFLTIQWDNHLADLLRYWTGRSAEKVLARTSRMNGQNFTSDNWLAVIADFGEGLTGHILHTELLRSSLGGVRCRVDGSEGSVSFNFNDNLLLESKLLGEGVREINGSDLSFPSSWCGTMGDLLIAVEEGREPLVSARQNLATIRTILAEDESARAGGVWVSCIDKGVISDQ